MEEVRRMFGEILGTLGIILERLKHLEETMSSNTQGLTDLQAAVAAETTQSGQVVAAFQALQAQIAALQAQPGEVTDAQLETLAQSLQAAQAAIAAAVTPPAATAAPGTAANAKAPATTS